MQKLSVRALMFIICSRQLVCLSESCHRRRATPTSQRPRKLLFICSNRSGGNSELFSKWIIFCHICGIFGLSRFAQSPHARLCISQMHLFLLYMATSQLLQDRNIANAPQLSTTRVEISQVVTVYCCLNDAVT